MDNKFKYDVFVSYSRKDYVDSYGNIIEDSPVKAIIEFLEQNQITYWFDKEGIYSGREFVELISEAINVSKIMLFVSSEHSNSSIYTTGEIFEAIECNRLIIPIKIDASNYNSKFRLLLRPLDYIDFHQSDAFSDLLRAIEVEKKRIAQIEEEEKKKRMKDEMEANKKVVKKEIEEYVAELNKLMIRKHTLLDSIYKKQRSIGVEQKVCPVCASKNSIEAEYCPTCGWAFSPLSCVGAEEDSSENSLLVIARANWNNLSSNYENRQEEEGIVDELEAKISSLKEEISVLKKEKEQLDSLIAVQSVNEVPKQSFISFLKECYRKHNIFTAVLLLCSIPIASAVGVGVLASLIDNLNFGGYDRFGLGVSLLAFLISYGNYQLFTFKRSIWIVAPFISFILGGLFYRYDGQLIGVALSIFYLFLFGVIFCFKKNGKRVIENFGFREGFKLFFDRFKAHNVIVKMLLPIFICISLGVGIFCGEEFLFFYGLMALAATYSGVQLILFDKEGVVNLVMLLIIVGVSSIYADDWRVGDGGEIGAVMLFVSEAILFISMSFAGSREIWKKFDKEYVANKLKYLFFIIFMWALFADVVREVINDMQ
ncbi:MAG: TIR domain-containing protein [Bacteroidales bacterium]|nr:TIR domain-containing protein [Bacteroidales bacterium]